MNLPSATPTRPGDASRWFLAAAVVAILDISFAATYWVVYRGVTTFPRLLQSIATGVLGKAAFQGGTGSALVGAAAHCTVALGWSALFLIAARRWPSFRRVLGGRGGVLKVGVPFGLFVWLVMDFVIIPLSHATPTPVTAIWFWVSLVWHGVGVGPPMAVILRER